MNTEDSTQIATVQVDREMCQTAATCLAWNIYELDDESKAVLLTNNGKNSDDYPSNPLTTLEGTVKVGDLLNDENVDLAEMQTRVLESAKACPFNAIIVRDAEGRLIWPPE